MEYPVAKPITIEAGGKRYRLVLNAWQLGYALQTFIGFIRAEAARKGIKPVAYWAELMGETDAPDETGLAVWDRLMDMAIGLITVAPQIVGMLLVPDGAPPQANAVEIDDAVLAMRGREILAQLPPWGLKELATSFFGSAEWGWTRAEFAKKLAKAAKE